jgi:type I restriction enzyme, S subunit
VSELPSGWASTTLGDASTPIRGVTYKKDQARGEVEEGYVPLLRATNIDNGLVLERDLIFVPDSVVKSDQYMRVGDVVLATSSGSASVVGKSAELRQEWTGTFGAFCMVLRPSELLEPSFLAHYVGSPSVRQRWTGLAAGTNINNLKRGDIAATSLPLPPLNEQRRIVAAIEEHLSRLDAAEGSLRVASARLSVLPELLDSELVRGWETRRLDQVCPVFVDCPHRTPKYEVEGIPALRPRDVVGGALQLDTAARVGRTEFELQTKRRVPVEGDVIYSRELSYGWAALVPQNAELCLSQGMVLFRPDESLLPEFLALVLNGSRGREQARRAATGSAHPHINLRDIRAYELPVPPLEVQKTIVGRVQMQLSAIGALRAAIERAQRRSKALRRAVLERAFRGDLVPQDPSDEPASVLLERISAERVAAPPVSRRRTTA